MLDLLRTLQTEADAVARFADLLRQEQNTLAIGDVDALTPLIEQKNSVAAELTACAQRRNALLAAEGLTPDRTGIEAWCALHPANTDVSAAWSRILLLARDAHELNRVNGELIQIRMQHNAQGLEALLGASRSLELYGPDGQTAAHSGRRINDAA